MYGSRARCRAQLRKALASTNPFSPHQLKLSPCPAFKMVRLELTDDNLLRLNAAAFGAHGAWAFAHPQSYNDTFTGDLTTRNDTKDRWFGLAAAGVGAHNLAAAEGQGIGAGDAKKNALLACGALWGAAALFHAHNLSSKKTKNDALQVGNGVVMAGMSALNIWKGAGGKDKRAKATVK